MKTKQINCDVLVVGAGISGVAAAIAASRCQAKTVLIEKNSFPGGIAVGCQHRYICGLYPKNTGIAKDIILSLQKLNPKNKFMRIGKLSVFSFVPGSLQLTLRQLMQKEKNLKVYFNKKITTVSKTADSIISLKAISVPLIFKPKVVIDASGQGIIIKLSGAKYQLADKTKRQSAGFNFQVRNLNSETDTLPIKVPYCLSLGAKQNKLPKYFKFTNFTFDQTKDSGTIKLNLPAKNTFRGKPVTKRCALKMHTYLCQNLPEFKNSQIHWIASGIAEREGLRLYGEHILTEQEVMSSKKFPLPAAKGYWPIEFWHQKQGQKIKYLKTKQFYEIPLSCLKSKNIDNLFATGKCISATSKALASSRVMGTCIYLGQAAGKAAASYTGHN